MPRNFKNASEPSPAAASSGSRSPAARIDDDCGTGRFSYDGLDRLIHERARLGILTCLAGRPNGMVFGELKALCALTDGNLSRHLAILSEGRLVEIWKGTRNHRPQTLVRLTAVGRQRFQEYINVLENVVADALAAAQARAHASEAQGSSTGEPAAESAAPLLMGKLAPA